jgi:hypothetical protein
LCREWVKNDLRARMCQPIRVRWRPFAWQTSHWRCSFTVVYADLHDQVHRAICWTPWLSPNIVWVSDEIILRSSGKGTRYHHPGR